MTDERDLVEFLEGLSVTLGAVKDALTGVGGDYNTEKEIHRLNQTVRTCRLALESHDKIGPLVRINRELREQLSMIRDIARDAADTEDSTKS